MKQYAKINTLRYFLFVIKFVFSNEDLIDIIDWDSDTGHEICDWMKHGVLQMVSFNSVNLFQET